MIFIGITGGVGAGKTAILSYIRENYNSQIWLADEVAHDLMKPGGICYQPICALFSEDCLTLEDGTFDRLKMARVIFSDPQKREALNQIVHPAVKAFVLREAEKAKREQKADLLLLEAALLIEEQYDKICDELWYIYTSETNRMLRLMESRGYSKQKVEQIFSSQLREEVYREHCSVVIDNNGTPEDTCAQIRQFLSERKVNPVER